MPYFGDLYRSDGSERSSCGCSQPQFWTAHLSTVCYLAEVYAQVQLLPSSQHRIGWPMAIVSLQWCGPLLSRSRKEVVLGSMAFFMCQDWCLKPFQESQTMEVVVSRVWEVGERTSHPPEALQHVRHCRIIELLVGPLLKQSRRAAWWKVTGIFASCTKDY